MGYTVHRVAKSRTQLSTHTYILSNFLVKDSSSGDFKKDLGCLLSIVFTFLEGLNSFMPS